MKTYRIVVVPEDVDSLPFVQRRTMEMFVSNCEFTITQLARSMGRNRKRIRGEIKKMEQAGYVECVSVCSM